MSTTETTNGKEKKIPALSIQLFGGILVSDGAGFYPGLELLNLVYGVENHEILPPPGKLTYVRRSQEYARKLVWDAEFQRHPNSGQLVGDGTLGVLKHLFRCLQLRIPNMNKEPEWHRAHFFPYTRSLIHWDARIAKKKSDEIAIERRYLRGAGAYAFQVLRESPQKQLEQLRAAFENLYPSTPTPLERLAEVMDQNSLRAVGLEQSGDLEEKVLTFSDEDEENFRIGTLNILTQDGLSVTARVSGLLSWVGFWLAVTQLRRVCASLGREQIPILVDCGSTPGQLRRDSADALNRAVSAIRDAVDAKAKLLEMDNLKPIERTKVSAFFTGTGATIGLVNAFTGRRYFVAGLDLLEMLVMAGTSQGSEIPFSDFMRDFLYSKCHLVVCKDAAEKIGLLERMDSSVFEDNEHYLAERMKAQGLLSDYSDSTRMVSLRGLA